MDNNYLENFINRFPNVLLSHTLKLSDITDSKAVQLDDSQMLKSIEAFPNKFELEIIRFWRKKKLLPFFEEGKHAKISLSQLMWLRFLENLRNLSSNTAVLEAAHEYFLKRAYDKDLALTNYLSLKKTLLNDLSINPENQVAKFKLDYVTSILKDNFLMYSIKIDMNYFNMYIMDEVINPTKIKTLFTYRMGKKIIDSSGHAIETPVFAIIKDGKVINEPDDEKNKNFIEFDLKITPLAVFSASYFLRDVFADCNISEEAFNIQILEENEQALFAEIRNKNVKDLRLNSLENPDLFIKYTITNVDGSYNTNGIKEVKYILGTKSYSKGIIVTKENKEKNL
jgi:hypothetical protein